MRSVAVVATGKTAFGSFPELSIRELAREAGAKCLEGSKAAPAQVEALYVGNFAGPSFVGQNHLAPYIGSALGLEGVPCTRFEAACASSGSAFFHAYSAVAGGLYDLVLVVGVEKMTSQTTARTTDILASAGDLGGEVKAGATFPSLFAMIAKRHMHDFGTTREHLAAVAVKNHANGAKNPLAHSAQAHHDREGFGRPHDRGASYSIRLLVDQRRRGSCAAMRIRPCDRVHGQTGMCAQRGTGVGPPGAR